MGFKYTELIVEVKCKYHRKLLGDGKEIGPEMKGEKGLYMPYFLNFKMYLFHVVKFLKLGCVLHLMLSKN